LKKEDIMTSDIIAVVVALIRVITALANLLKELRLWQ